MKAKLQADIALVGNHMDHEAPANTISSPQEVGSRSKTLTQLKRN
jgi:hypothetical protein